MDVVGGVGLKVGTERPKAKGVGGVALVTVIHAPGVFEGEVNEGGGLAVGGGAGLLGEEAGDVGGEVEEVGEVVELDDGDAVGGGGVIMREGVFAEAVVPALEGVGPKDEVGAGLVAAGVVVGKTGKADDEAGDEGDDGDGQQHFKEGEAALHPP